MGVWEPGVPDKDLVGWGGGLEGAVWGLEGGGAAAQCLELYSQHAACEGSLIVWGMEGCICNGDEGGVRWGRWYSFE